MSMRPIAIGGIALLVLFGLWAANVDAQEQGDTIACSECHEQGEAFAGNVHAKGETTNGQVPNAVCESCHGSGAAHIEGGGDPDQIVHPKGRAGADVCLACHDKPNDQKSHAAGFHANTDAVNCLSCHSVHSSNKFAGHLLIKKPTELCSSCHMSQAASFRNKPYAHNLGDGGMNCVSCHEPHARRGESLRLTSAGEMVCLNCHVEKKGPYVFPHGAAEVGGCLACHDTHGSTNPKRLKRTRVYQLCLECHSPITGDTLGSQPPAFHNLTLPRYQNCTTCHTAVHGSNRSPQLLK